MPHWTRIAILTALVSVSVGLSVALFRESRVAAKGLIVQDTWVAADAHQAVKTVLGAHSFSYLDQALIPGMYRNVSLPKKVKALRTKQPEIKIQAEGGVTYLATRPKSDVPYKTKNAFPKTLWTAKLKNDGSPVIELRGQDETKFKLLPKTPGAEVDTDQTVIKNKTVPRALMKPTRTANKFAVSLKSKEGSPKKAAKITITPAQLKQFKNRIETAKREGNGLASALFPGSLNDRSAVFVPIVRVRRGVATDFRIIATAVH